jgi:uncharacterized membrane protein YhaH (DUF805 family)
MSFGDAIATCFRKYADFKGRASRAEYWWFMLLVFLVYLGLVFVSAALANSSEAAAGLVALIMIVALLGLVVPSLAVAVRRLHDTGRSGWWYLIALIPYVGSLVLLIVMALPGTPGPNQYGMPPGGPMVAGIPPMPPPTTPQTSGLPYP